MEGRDQDLLDALKPLAEEKKQARVTHAYRVVKRFGLPIRTRAEVDSFIIKAFICAIFVEVEPTLLLIVEEVEVLLSKLLLTTPSHFPRHRTN